MKKHISRINYVHFKDTNPLVKSRVIKERIGFYDACAQGIFCNLGKGEIDFTEVRNVLINANFNGWCTVEQDCDPNGKTSPIIDALRNREYLHSIGF
jgi:inosose dehydratase